MEVVRIATRWLLAADGAKKKCRIRLFSGTV
jgi:hypothetical protein